MSLRHAEPAHKPCNLARGNKPLTEWFAAHPPRRRPPLAPSREWFTR
jgi:hypothetical protein